MKKIKNPCSATELKKVIDIGADGDGTTILEKIDEAIVEALKALDNLDAKSEEYGIIDKVRSDLNSNRAEFVAKGLNVAATKLAGKAEDLKQVKAQLDDADKRLKAVAKYVGKVATAIGGAISVLTAILKVVA